MQKYSQIETTLSYISMRITGFYKKQGTAVPEDFGEKNFIEFAEMFVTDKAKLSMIKSGHTIRARKEGDGYTVMLCDEKSGNKMVEDLSCTLSKVDVMYEKDAVRPCEFEKDWQKYCER